MRKIQFFKILFLICFWIFCTIFIVFYEASILEFQSEIGGEYCLFRTLFFAILSCIIGGTILGVFDIFYLSYLLRKKPFGITLITKTFIYLLFIFIFTSGTEIYIYSKELSTSVFSEDVYTSAVSYLFSFKSFMNISYWCIACIMAHFILLVNDKFGQGILINFLLGKYHTPKEEERIFMFLDLKSSTSYAEKLGHFKYSQFIQDCFFDITEIITKYEAQIYQYVGDEVVLSWRIYEGLKKGNCIKTFLAYDHLLKSKKTYYQKKYGIIPQFKSGLHLGKVTVAEVGEIKKELAFHGDAINTAARIQGKCNDFKKSLLVSESVKSHLEGKGLFNFDPLGKVFLKGKMHQVDLFGLKPI